MIKSNVIKKTPLAPTALIVGGAGFVGSHLAEALLLRDTRVIVVDNFSTGKDIYISSLLKNPRFAVFNADINLGIPEQIKSVDYIFHLAGLETYLFDKEFINLDALLTNAIGTKNVLDFCKVSEAKLLLASSIDVYKGAISPISLDTYFGQNEADEKKYSLTEAKRYAEALTWEYFKKFNLDVRIARLPEIYGPRMSFTSTGALGTAIKSLVDHRELVIYGEGTEKEYYLYISDAIAGILKALFTDKTQGKIFTFVGKEPHTVLETTYLVKSLAHSEITILFKPKRLNNLVQDAVIPDISTLASLKWEPKTSFKEGILNTLKWLGYDPNEHTFKPAKLIEEKQKEKDSQTKDKIDSLTSNVSNVSTLEQKTVTNAVTEAAPTPDMTIPVSKVIPKEKSLFMFKIRNRLANIRNKFKYKPQGSIEIKKNISNTHTSGLRKVLFTYIIGIFALLALFIGVPLVQTYVHTKLGVKEIQSSLKSLKELDYLASQDTAESAFKEFYKAEVSFGRLKWLFTITNTKNFFNNTLHLLNTGAYAARTTYFTAKGVGPMLSIWESLKPANDIKVDQIALNQAVANLQNAKNNLDFANVELSYIPKNKLPQQIRDNVGELETAAVTLDTLSQLAQNIPDLVGIGGKKDYLLLFQNSNEMRPTGGFVGSYAILSFENGKIADLVIDDIYNPDGQILLRDIKVTPPNVLQTYLNEDVLFIRNANWDPDFEQSALKIQDLFFKLDGRSFDGVFAFDLDFIKNILDATGPIYLAAYNEEITADNLYERTQFHSEFNYTNGSDQKRSFLTVLGGKLLEKIFSLDKDALFKTASSVHKSLNEKHFLIYIPNNPINALFDQMNWTGKLVSPKDMDYLYVVNANLGGTKANYFVKNSMNYNINSLTRDGKLRATLDLVYEHTGEDTAWPGGPYTNYVRIYTRKGSNLTATSIQFDSGDKQDIFTEVATNTINDYTVYEIGFVLQPSSKLTLSLGYDLAEDQTLLKDTSKYGLYWQKQPGTNGDPVSIEFNAPFGKSIVSSNIGDVASSEKVLYTGDLVTDTAFIVALE